MMSTPSYLYTFLFLLINYIRKNLLCYACFYSSTIRSVYVQRGQSWFFSWGRTTSGSLPRLTVTEQIYSKVILQNYVNVTTLIFSFNNKQKFTLNMFSFSRRYIVVYVKCQDIAIGLTDVIVGFLLFLYCLTIHSYLYIHLTFYFFNA